MGLNCCWFLAKPFSKVGTCLLSCKIAPSNFEGKENQIFIYSNKKEKWDNVCKTHSDCHMDLINC